MIYVDGGARLRQFTPPHSRLLDVGCGTGRTAAAYHQGMDDVEIHGVDAYHDLSEVASFIHFQKRNVDGVPLPYGDEYFDVVVLSHILEHLQDPLNLIRESWRVLAPSGVVYVETPSVRSLFVPSLRYLNDQYASANFFDDFTHVGRPQTFHSLFHLLDRNRFDVIELAYARPRRWIREGVRFVVAGASRRNRAMLCTGIWHLVGWAIYSIARKNMDKRIASHV
jgi:SAM-dependent methyltransferase